MQRRCWFQITSIINFCWFSFCGIFWLNGMNKKQCGFVIINSSLPFLFIQFQLSRETIIIYLFWNSIQISIDIRLLRQMNKVNEHKTNSLPMCAFELWMRATLFRKTNRTIAEWIFSMHISFRFIFSNNHIFAFILWLADFLHRTMSLTRSHLLVNLIALIAARMVFSILSYLWMRVIYGSQMYVHIIWERKSVQFYISFYDKLIMDWCKIDIEKASIHIGDGEKTHLFQLNELNLKTELSWKKKDITTTKTLRTGTTARSHPALKVLQTIYINKKKFRTIDINQR